VPAPNVTTPATSVARRINVARRIEAAFKNDPAMRHPQRKKRQLKWSG
jgi:hypothetical protein